MEPKQPEKRAGDDRANRVGLDLSSLSEREARLIRLVLKLSPEQQQLLLDQFDKDVSERN